MKSCFTILCLLVALAGCARADQFLGSTTSSYTPGGQLYYQSSKNQEGFKAITTFDPVTGNLTGLNIETTATTPEAAMTAAMEATKAAMDTFNKLVGVIVPLLTKGAGAAAGIP